VTDDDLFKMLNKAEEMSLENWRVYRALYNAELGKLADRIEELEAALREIIQKDALNGKTIFVGDFGKIARKALEGKDD